MSEMVLLKEYFHIFLAHDPTDASMLDINKKLKNQFGN